MQTNLQLTIQKKIIFGIFKNVYFNLKLEQTIDKYDSKQIQKIDRFIDDLNQLLVKSNDDLKINWELFKSNWLKKLGDENKIEDIAITFALNDFENPIIEVEIKKFDPNSHSRTYDYFKNQLKTVLKPDSNIMKYLKLNSINLKSTNKSPKDFKL